MFAVGTKSDRSQSEGREIADHRHLKKAIGPLRRSGPEEPSSPHDQAPPAPRIDRGTTAWAPCRGEKSEPPGETYTMGAARTRNDHITAGPVGGLGHGVEDAETNGSRATMHRSETCAHGAA